MSIEQDITRQLKQGQQIADGVIAALGLTKLPSLDEADEISAELDVWVATDEDYEAQEKIKAQYNEGENFHEPESDEQDAACASSIIDADNRAGIMEDMG